VYPAPIYSIAEAAGTALLNVGGFVTEILSAAMP